MTIEAVDCAECNSSLEWHGDLPDDPEEIRCYQCERDALTARAEKAEAERDEARAALEQQAASLVCAIAERERLRSQLEGVEGLERINEAGYEAEIARLRAIIANECYVVNSVYSGVCPMGTHGCVRHHPRQRTTSARRDEEG